MCWILHTGVCNLQYMSEKSNTKARHWLGFDTTLAYKTRVQNYVADSNGRWASVAHLMREGIEKVMGEKLQTDT